MGSFHKKTNHNTKQKQTSLTRTYGTSHLFLPQFMKHIDERKQQSDTYIQKHLWTQQLRRLQSTDYVSLTTRVQCHAIYYGLLHEAITNVILLPIGNRLVPVSRNHIDRGARILWMRVYLLKKV